MKLKNSSATTDVRRENEVKRLEKEIKDVDRQLRLPKSDKDRLLDQRLEYQAALAELGA